MNQTTITMSQNVNVTLSARRKKITSHQRQLIERAHHCLPGGSTGNLYNDVVIARGRGGRVWDVSGNEYVDYLLGSGPMLIGHAHPQVVEAVQRQVERGTTFFSLNEQAIELAERIVEAVACAQQVRYLSSGTEATHFAMRTARTYARRDMILKFEGGFHGMNDYALMSMAPTQPPPFPQPVPDSPGIPRYVEQGVIIAPFNNAEMACELIERHRDQLGGVIVEPFQRLIPPQPGFLQALRQTTQQCDVPLIFDEVVTGFRFAYGGAQQYYGVVPDLCALGKVLAGGFPLAAVAGPHEIMKHFDPAQAQDGQYIPQIGTLNGNPVAAAAGLATLDVLRRPGTYEQLFATGRQLMQALTQLLKDAAIPARVVGEPPLFDVVFTDQPIIDYRSTLTADKQKQKRFTQALLDHGVFKGESKLYVSTAHTPQDVDATIEAFASAVKEICEL